MFKFVADHDNKKVMFQIEHNSFYVKGGIRQALQKTGKTLRDYARKEILDKTKKTGRIYHYMDVKRLKRGGIKMFSRAHRASAPGEFPANLSGALQKSIKWTVVSYKEIDFGATAPYAGYLENGTSRMLPRPFLKMSINNNQKIAIEYLETEVKKALDKAAQSSFNKYLSKKIK